jgi:heme-degrading monooxygenase HmoA
VNAQSLGSREPSRLLGQAPKIVQEGHPPLIREHALLPVRAGLTSDFEEALQRALPIIRSMPGCLNAEVSRCVEDPQLYLLLVEWERIEDHDPGFRQSERYQEWRALLHHFYDPFPTVQHFTVL